VERWCEEAPNLVTDAGLALLSDLAFGGVTRSSDWYIGIKGAGTPNPTDTLAVKAWSEYLTYAPLSRPAWTRLRVGISNYASSTPAVFTIPTGDGGWLHGIFVCDSAAKGGTTGLLYSVADFLTPRRLYGGDTLSVRYAHRISRPLSVPIGT